MKILIAYATVTGTSKKCCELLASHFGNHAVTIADLSKDFVDPKSFDFCIVGGSIRFGKLHKDIAKYLEAYGTALLSSKSAYFICSADSTQVDDNFEYNFPAELLRSAITYMNFGGVLDPSLYKNIFKKLMVKLFVERMRTDDPDNIENSAKPLPCIMPENISRFADIIKSNFNKV